MTSRRWLIALAVASAMYGLRAQAQSPSALYTWDNTGNASPNIESWVYNFGAGGTSATLTNAVPGELTITETSATVGGSLAISDGGNRVRESSTGASGGTDVLGLDWLEFEVGHNGSAPVNVQFFVQASTGFSFVALGPDVAVQPGVNTYQVPITGLTPSQAVYLRTVGMNIRDHAAQGNLTWTVREVRAGGTPLTVRDLETFDNGTSEGGLQGAIVNFDGASVLGNSGQNQTGLSHNSAGSGSLQWTDVAGGAGGAISFGNGTAWNGNSFNNRTTDLSNYQVMHVRMSAAETTTSEGGSINVQPFFQVNNFGSFLAANTLALPIDGQYHDLYFTMPVNQFMNVIDQSGLNLGSHTNELIVNVDLVQLVVPEPATMGLLSIAIAGCLSLVGRSRRDS
ncbi:MAG: PEP-CTERM sorting domain-containing protein [Pirellulales bacterium]